MERMNEPANQRGRDVRRLTESAHAHTLGIGMNNTAVNGSRPKKRGGYY